MKLSPFAIRLKEVRVAKNLSQIELARRAGLSPTVISHYEAGRRAPLLATCAAIADALGVSMDFLSGRDA
jgi:transcriptional regulator with XRE-family HTH domain